MEGKKMTKKDSNHYDWEKILLFMKWVSDNSEKIEKNSKESKKDA
jgi:hypothetical protein